MPPERRLQFVQLQHRVENDVRGLSDTVTWLLLDMIEWYHWRVFTWTFPQRQRPVVWVAMIFMLGSDCCA